MKKWDKNGTHWYTENIVFNLRKVLLCLSQFFFSVFFSATCPENLSMEFMAMTDLSNKRNYFLLLADSSIQIEVPLEGIWILW